MFIFSIIKGIFKKIQFVVNAYLTRLDKKNNDVSGYILKGPQNVKRLFIFLISLFFIGLLLAIFYKEGYMNDAQSILDRETSPGSKISSDTSINKETQIFANDKKNIKAEPFNCDALVASLQKNGRFSIQEKIDYEKYCKNNFSEDFIKLIDNLLVNDVKPETVKSILAKASPANVENINKALENKKLIESLSSQNGDVLSKELPNIANLSEDEMTKAIEIINQTPAQYRDDMIKTVGKVGAIESEEARGNVIGSLEASRSPEDIRETSEFLDVIGKASPDEQKVFSNVFKSASTPEEKNAIKNATKEIVSLDGNDPLRKVGLNKLKEAESILPEERKKVYDSIPNIVEEYKEIDPSSKEAIVETLKQAKNPDDVASLTKRLDDYTSIKDKLDEPLDSQKLNKYIKGVDKSFVDKVNAAVKLDKCNEIEVMKKLLAGDLSTQEIRKKLENCDVEISNNNSIENSLFDTTSSASNAGNSSSSTTRNKMARKVTQEKINEMEKEKAKLEDDKNKLEKKLEDFVRVGLPLSDPAVKPLINEISIKDNRLSAIDKEINESRIRLKQTVEDIKKRMQSELGDIGVTYSNLEIKLKEEDVKKIQPAERLKNIKDFEEFYNGSDNSYDRKMVSSLKFSYPKRKNITKQEVIGLINELSSKRAKAILLKSIEKTNSQTELEIMASIVDTSMKSDNVEQYVIAHSTVLFRNSDSFINKSYEEKSVLNEAFRSVVSLDAKEEIRDELFRKIYHSNSFDEVFRTEMYMVLPNILEHYNKRNKSQKEEIFKFIKESKNPQDLVELSEKLDELYPVEFKRKKEKPSEIAVNKNSNSILDNEVRKIASNWVVPTSNIAVTGGNMNSDNEVQISRTMVIPGILKRLPDTGISSKNMEVQFLFEFGISVANRKTGKIAIPKGSIALCKSKQIDEDSGRMNAECDTVDVGGKEDLKVSLTLSDANGADGVLGLIIDHKGWKLAGIFLTAFSAAILEGVSAQYIEPIESKAQKGASDYLKFGVMNASSAIMQELAQKQIDKWSNLPVYWVGYDGMLATVKQK